MTIKLTSLRIDLEREKKGDWIAFPDWPGVEFNVSALNLPEFVSGRSALSKRLAKAYKGVDIPDNIRTPELGKLLAKHILHDWRGLDETYSPDRAYEIMSDWAFRDVTNAVLYCATMISQSDAEFLEDAGKNFVPPSDGGSKDKSRPTG